MSTHKEWVLTATGDSLRGVARALGMDSGQLSRESNKGLDADRVIEISYAYGLNPVVELQKTGHLRPETSDDTVDSILDRMLDLAEQAKNKLSNEPDPHVHPVVQDDYGLVADSSPDEDEMRSEHETGDVP